MIRSFADKMKGKQEAYQAEQRTLAEQAEQTRIQNEKLIFLEELKEDKARLNQIVADKAYLNEQRHLQEKEKQVYVLRLYGRTKKDKSVYCKVTGFTPYFYVEISSKWNDKHVNMFISHIKDMVYSQYRDSLISYDVVERHKFHGFTNKKKFRFIRLIFDNYNGMKKYGYTFYRKIKAPFSRKYKNYKVYESNIDPMFRCMHILDLDAAGWIKIKKKNFIFICIIF